PSSLARAWMGFLARHIANRSCRGSTHGQWVRFRGREVPFVQSPIAAESQQRRRDSTASHARRRGPQQPIPAWSNGRRHNPREHLGSFREVPIVAGVEVRLPAHWVQWHWSACCPSVLLLLTVVRAAYSS